LLKPKQILTATVELEAKKTGEAIFEPKIKYVTKEKPTLFNRSRTLASFAAAKPPPLTLSRKFP